MKNHKILQKLTIFHKISWHNNLILFSFDVLCRLLLSLLVLSNVDRKISVSYGLIQNCQISDLPMAKVKEVNIAIT
jgi:hypothetical protein